MAHAQRTILVVDDEAAQRELLGGYLESVGFRSRYAESAEDAIRQMAGELPDLVLLDIRLPGMNGIEALAEIHRQWSHVPVLLITAYADLRQAVESVKGGRLTISPSRSTWTNCMRR